MKCESDTCRIQGLYILDKIGIPLHSWCGT